MKTLHRFLLGMMVAGAPFAAHGSVLLNDNFNSENGGAGALNYASFLSWNVTGGSVDLQGNGFNDNYPGHGLYVDLDGSDNTSGTLTSKVLFPLSTGWYTLQFNLGNNPGNNPDHPEWGNNSMQVSLGSVYSETINRTGVVPMDTIQRFIYVPSPQSANLVFQELEVPGDSFGVIIDDVLLAEGVPEPSSLALVGGAVPILLLLRKRR